ncbi:MAG: hypothetical protein JRH06_12500 [Deltaproteobacteria bacterium]|nr:hypothetical protein [Deltaproteobacteria bacterium]MBW2138362.1 hypothetical protein [Deltaproteobacteria bacterium]
MKKILLVGLMTALLFTLCGPAGATPQTHAPYEIEIVGLFAGSTGYVVANALAGWINKDSKWLKATAPESLGGFLNVKEVVAEPRKRKTRIFFTNREIMWAAKRGLGPYAAPPFNSFNYDEFKALWFCLLGGGSYITTNPDIKTFADLDGKKVVIESEAGGVKSVYLLNLFKQAGVKPKGSYMKSPVAVGALKDGMVDAIWGTSDLKSLPNTWAPGGRYKELIATRDVYPINMPKGPYAAMVKDLDFLEPLAERPPFTFGKKQTAPWTVKQTHMYWAAHQDMPDHVVLEVLNILYEHCEELGNYKASQKLVTKKTMGAMGLPEEALHRAALAFYKEKGMGLEDITIVGAK